MTRQLLDTDDPHHRAVCVDRMTVAYDGRIDPAKITFRGVKRSVLTDGNQR